MGRGGAGADGPGVAFELRCLRRADVDGTCVCGAGSRGLTSSLVWAVCYSHPVALSALGLLDWYVCFPFPPHLPPPPHGWHPSSSGAAPTPTQPTCGRWACWPLSWASGPPPTWHRSRWRRCSPSAPRRRRVCGTRGGGAPSMVTSWPAACRPTPRRGRAWQTCRATRFSAALTVQRRWAPSSGTSHGRPRRREAPPRGVRRGAGGGAVSWRAHVTIG